jgi:Amt family ammonium transporter
MSQLVGTIVGVFIALAGGYIVYTVIHKMFNFRLTEEEEFNGADISIHKINSISSE